MKTFVGFALCGSYVNCDVREADGKMKYYALVAVGVDSFRVSVSPQVYAELVKHRMGELVMFTQLRQSVFNGRLYTSASECEFIPVEE